MAISRVMRQAVVYRGRGRRVLGALAWSLAAASVLHGIRTSARQPQLDSDRPLHPVASRVWAVPLSQDPNDPLVWRFQVSRPDAADSKVRVTLRSWKSQMVGQSRWSSSVSATLGQFGPGEMVKIVTVRVTPEKVAAPEGLFRGDLNSQLYFSPSLSASVTVDDNHYRDLSVENPFQVKPTGKAVESPRPLPTLSIRRSDAATLEEDTHFPQPQTKHTATLIGAADTHAGDGGGVTLEIGTFAHTP